MTAQEIAPRRKRRRAQRDRPLLRPLTALHHHLIAVETHKWNTAGASFHGQRNLWFTNRWHHRLFLVKDNLDEVQAALFLMVAIPLAACATVPAAGEDAATIKALRLKPMKKQGIRSRVIGTYNAPYTHYSEHYGPDGASTPICIGFFGAAHSG